MPGTTHNCFLGIRGQNEVGGEFAVASDSPSPPKVNWKILGKLHNFSVPQCPICEMGIIMVSTPLGGL